MVSFKFKWKKKRKGRKDLKIFYKILEFLLEFVKKGKERKWYLFFLVLFEIFVFGFNFFRSFVKYFVKVIEVYEEFSWFFICYGIEREVI